MNDLPPENNVNGSCVKGLEPYSCEKRIQK